MDVLRTSGSAMINFQRAMSTVQHNIANSQTDGYSRRRVEFSSIPGATRMMPGAGVKIENINRISWEPWVKEARRLESGYQLRETVASELSQWDSLVSNETTGLNKDVREVVAGLIAIQPASDNRASRVEWLDDVEKMVDKFKGLDSYLENSSRKIDNQLSLGVKEVNSLLSQVAEVNKQRMALGNAVDLETKDQMDDRLGKSLSEFISVDVRMDDNGLISVRSANGQSLVEAGNFTGITYSSDKGISLGKEGQGGESVGGKLGGLLFVKNNTIPSARESLLEKAKFFNDKANRVFSSGEAINGTQGRALFTGIEGGISSWNVNVSDVDDLGWNSGLSLSVSGGSQNILENLSYSRKEGGVFPVEIRFFSNQQYQVNSGPIMSYELGQTIEGDGWSFSMKKPVDDGTAVSLFEADGNQDFSQALALFDSVEGANNWQGSVEQMSVSWGSEARRVTMDAESWRRGLEVQENLNQSYSGVNLDEEAVDMLRYQQAYDASAQMIATSNAMFRSLIQAVSR